MIMLNVFALIFGLITILITFNNVPNWLTGLNAAFVILNSAIVLNHYAYLLN